MYTQLPPNQRAGHPYHMYDEILAQPDVVATALNAEPDKRDEACGIIAGGRRIFVVGCGTSFHAARGGAALLRHFSRGSLDARGIQAFELVTYLHDLRPDDVVIGVSHSGTTAYTLAALDAAQRAGADTIGITGFPSSPIAQHARTVLFSGYGEERSWAHTASYIAALTTFAAIANTLAAPEEQLELSPLSEAVREALRLEPAAHRLAAGAVTRVQDNRPLDMVLVGPGPNATTAREGVLKLLETTFLPARSFQLEETLHGPLASMTSETLLILLIPGSEPVERAMELMRAVGQIGIEPVILVTDETAERFPDDHRLLLPDVPEALSPITAVIPLQLFSYFLAVGLGHNPDVIRRDDERYRQAAAQYE